MRDQDLTRLARWVIPGWLSIFLILLYSFVDVAMAPSKQNVRPFFEHLLLLKEQTLDVSTAAALAAIFLALSIPLGFLLYQVYFYFRWNSPFSAHGDNPLFNSPGRFRDSQYLESVIECDKKWTNNILYKISHKYKWRYIELLFCDTIKDENSIWFQRYRYLQEILHTLGAASVAVIFAFSVYIIFKMYTVNNLSPGEIDVNLSENSILKGVCCDIIAYGYFLSRY